VQIFNKMLLTDEKVIKTFKDNNFVIGSLSASTEYSLQTDTENKKLVSDKSRYIHLNNISTPKNVLTRIRNL